MHGRKRSRSEHALQDCHLAENIQEAYHGSRQVYGSPQIHTEVRIQGIVTLYKRVARLMREQNLSACQLDHSSTFKRAQFLLADPVFLIVSSVHFIISCYICVIITGDCAHT